MFEDDKVPSKIFAFIVALKFIEWVQENDLEGALSIINTDMENCAEIEIPSLTKSYTIEFMTSLLGMQHNTLNEEQEYMLSED